MVILGTAVELDEGEELPLIDNYDALWVMGGPMDVWEEEKYPWLCDEKNFIKKAVEEKGLPYLGVCLRPSVACRCSWWKGSAIKNPRNRDFRRLPNSRRAKWGVFRWYA
jgi:hypothetical protein